MIRTEKFNLNVNFSFGFTTINMVMCNPFASLCCYMEGQSKNKLHKLKQKTEFSFRLEERAEKRKEVVVETLQPIDFSIECASC